MRNNATYNPNGNEEGPDRSSDETFVSYGLILRMPLERIPDLKDAIKNIPGAELLYQKPSIKRLDIVERS
ncbi:hypothetical protein [Methanomassiliicoccus luminyensis]|uniref:hypothetical protein n=1 Tax=Methanomassiliicoccus luminyensis TaxID=1080712 RepID=UPI0011C90C56|nr:hypothetical protein [Methanomassiliicoccus luminyensis]